MQRIIGSLLAVALWLTVWLSPLLLAMAAGCMLVWAVQGDDYLVDALSSCTADSWRCWSAAGALVD
ncbi:hypothetical protein Q7C15_17000 [Aeromonas salmonicida]